MNKKTLTEKHPLIISIIYSLLILIFPIVAGVLTTINQSNPAQTKLIQGICFMFAVLVALLIMKKSKYSFTEYGFTLPTKKAYQQVLLYVPMILVELIGLLAGFGKQNTLFYVLMVLFMTIMVGIAEEAFFRGLVLKSLSGKGYKYAVAVGSTIFGVAHLGNLAGGADLIDTIMQVFFAVLFGFVCAELVVVSKSILWPILFHFLHDFIAFIGSEVVSTQRYFFILGIQIVILLVYSFYLWKKINKLEEPI